MNTEKKVKNKQIILSLKFLALVISIFTVVTAFSSILNVMSYQKLTTEVYTDASNLSVTGIRNNIQYSTSFGKPIERFYGIDKLLEDALSVSTDILGVGVIDSNCKVLYSSGEKISSVSNKLLNNKYVEDSNGIYTSSPINEKSSMVLLLDKSFVSTNVNDYIQSIIQIDLLVMLAVAVLSLLVFFILLSIKGSINFNILKISGILLLIAAQLVLGTFVVKTFTDEYTASVSKISDGVSQTVKGDLEKIMAQGIKMEEIVGLDAYFNTLVQDIPEISDISITNHKIGDSSTTKIVSDNNVYYVNVNSHVNEETIQNKVIEVSIDAAVLIAITVLLSLEISLFIGSSIKEGKKKKLKKEMDISGIRLFFFIIQIALGLDTGFISIVSYNLFKNLNDPNAPNTLIGLPVTVGILATVIGVMVWGKLISKVGLKTAIILGVAFSAIGLVLSSFSSTLGLFSVSRFIYGFGLAAILASTRMCASAQNSIEERTKFSSAISVGMLVGASCGVVIGGLLADRTSYSFVFMLAAIVSLIGLLLFPVTNIKNTIKLSGFSFQQVKKIFTIPSCTLYIFLIVIPICISSMFINYSIPLFGNEINLSQTIISAMIMMNYITTAYLTNPLSRVSMKKFTNKKLILIYELMIITSITLFCLFNNLFVAIISVIVLAIADSFGLIVIVEALYEQKISGLDRTTFALIFIFVSKIGSGIAPTLIGAGISNGVASASKIIPYVMVGGLLIFIIVSRFFTRKKLNLNES
ncbi:MAG: hypothetical protein RUMPE_01100 [Eubacteriales bacterium SKADARSKE-1]|nr:hypothetical protein [Eubacteriales bacterium SKADARSKE-1]